MSRACRYRADLPCKQPHLMCAHCPYKPKDEYVSLVPAGPTSVNPIAWNNSGAHPYVKFRDSMGRPAIEVGIKGTF